MGTLLRTFTERLSGDRPSPLRAAVAAFIAGVIVAVLVYKALRS